MTEINSKLLQQINKMKQKEIDELSKLEFSSAKEAIDYIFAHTSGKSCQIDENGVTYDTLGVLLYKILLKKKKPF